MRTMHKKVKEQETKIVYIVVTTHLYSLQLKMKVSHMFLMSPHSKKLLTESPNLTYQIGLLPLFSLTTTVVKFSIARR